MNYISAFTGLAVKGLLFTRVYALIPNINWIHVLLATLVGVQVAGNLVFTIVERCDIAPPIDLLNRAFIVATTCSAIFEAVVIIVTTWYSWRIIKSFPTKAFFGGDNPSILGVLLQQGIFRFILMFSWLMAATVEFPLTRTSLTNVDSPLENSISVILVCRFFLQLRKANRKQSGLTSFTECRNLSSFRAVVGTLGQMVIHDMGDHDLYGTTSRNGHDNDITR